MSSKEEFLLHAQVEESRGARSSLLGWYGRKRRNRRFERKHVLDVKLRSGQRRQNRVRRLTVVLMVLGSVFLGLIVVWRGGEELLRRFVYENPAFAIHHLEVQTDGVIAIDQLRRWAGVKLDDNLFALELGRIKRDLELVPSIETVSVERILPHTLRIFVTEREPVAQVQVPPAQTNGGRLALTYHLDAKGFVLCPLEGFQLAVPTLTNNRLPLLVGVPPAELRFGRQVESPQVRSALQLIQAFERSSMVGLADLKQVDVSVPGILVVATGQRSEIVFGLAEMEVQFRRWRVVHEYSQKLGRCLAALDLSVTNNVPARWSEASPSEVPQPLKPSRYKKKHV
jgi:hypothetical protein